MEKIFITGHQDRKQEFFNLLKTHPDASLIIYTNSNFSNPVESHQDMLHLKFDDIFSDDLAERGYKIPNAKMIENVLNFSKNKKKIISCCHAGISRSSSTALLIAAREWGIDKALDILIPGRHYPNRLIVYLGSQILKMPELYDCFADWYLKNYKYDLNNFVLPKSVQKN